MTHLDRIVKSRDTILPKKVHIVKSVVLPIVMVKLTLRVWTVRP